MATRRPADPDRRRRWPVILLAALLVLLVGGGVVYALLNQNAGTGEVPPAATSQAAPTETSAAPAEEPTTQPEATTTAPATTTPVTTTEAAPPPADPGTVDPVAFVQNYYSLLPDNTDAAWALLSPQAQAASSSQGQTGYNNFWAGFSDVSFTDATATGANTTSGTVRFVRNDGSTSNERYSFVLGDQDGTTVIQSFSQG